MNICIVATICKETGALSIYNQLMSHLKEEQQPNEHYYIFIDPSMPTPQLQNVQYIKYATNGVKRAKFDFWDFKNLCEQNHIKPDVILSLNNSGVKYPDVKQFIYYHQSIPLYKYKIKSWDKASIRLRCYQKFLPIYIKRSLSKDCSIIVQTPIIKTLFSRKYKFPLEKILVAFPDIKQPDTESIKEYSFDNKYFHFLYPAARGIYKEHNTLVKAIKLIDDCEIRNKVRVHLTLSKGTKPSLEKEIRDAGLTEQFIFHGSIPHDVLLSMYKGSNGLLFPSMIETIGLPLLEAASFGIPIVANNIDFVNEVLKGYTGLIKVPTHDYKKWSNEICNLCLNRQKYSEYKLARKSDWILVLNAIKSVDKL